MEGNIAYRRAVRMAIGNVMRSGAEGVKVHLSGRLNNAEMARSEMFKEGRTPLHTLRADIDYAQDEAYTKVGLIGVKVWIMRGEVYERRDLSPNYRQAKPNDRRGSGRRDGADRGDRRGNRRPGFGRRGADKRRQA